MEYIIVLITNVISIFFAIISYKRFKRFFNPVLLFNVSWILVINISSKGYFDLYKPSYKVYMMALMLLCAFSLTCLLIKGRKNYEDISINKLELKVNYKIIYIINMICILYLFPATVKAVTLLVSGGFTSVRTAMGTGELGIETTLQWIITSAIIAPVFNATIILSILLYILDNSNIKILFLAIFDIVLYTLSFGGRWLILRVIILILLALGLSKDFRNQIIKGINKIKKKLYFIILVGSGFLVYITSQRGFNNNILRTVIIYFTGSLSYFEQHIQNTSNRIYLFGTAFFAGLLDFPLILIQKLFRIDFLRPAEYVGQFTSPNIVIGDGTIFNGFGSALLDFWLDFGVFGPVIDGILLAIIIMYLYRKVSGGNIRRYAIYIFTLMLIVISPVKWECDLQWPWMTILFIIIFTNNKKYKIRF